MATELWGAREARRCGSAQARAQLVPAAPRTHKGGLLVVTSSVRIGGKAAETLSETAGRVKECVSGRGWAGQ